MRGAMIGRRRQRGQRGFTLIELMTVVIIVGVLAVVAFVAYRKYIFASKSAEAVHVIGSIKAAQEAYKDETFLYKNVSTGGIAGGALYPRAPGVGKTEQAVAFGYLCEAGDGVAKKDFPSPPGGRVVTGWPSGSQVTTPWYVVVAMGDANKDGNYSLFASSSLSSEVYSENEDE
jgi:prepilin-type N-terminal cleavage/methylation domain-containing protein